jgi:ATP-dependent DNA helicase RecQ
MRERFGISMVAAVLKGSGSQKIKQYQFDTLPTYGLMRNRTEKEISDIINVLVAEGYLCLTEGQYPVVKLQDGAAQVLQGRISVYMKVSRKMEVTLSDDRLFERLRELRKELAQRDKVPPYIIFPDSTLREMSEICPTSPVAMKAIKGMGEIKFGKYGQPFLELLRDYAGVGYE